MNASTGVIRYVATIGLLLSGILLSQRAAAVTYTWQPAAVAQSGGYVVLPKVTIIGNRIEWGAGAFDGDFAIRVVPTPTGGFGIGNAIDQAKKKKAHR
jgi:hypothetical protein